jgi:hypothetical protein
MRAFMSALLILALTACVTTPPPPAAAVAPAESIIAASDDLQDLRDVLAENGERSTLLVLDIDDTLLTSTTFFGSDNWVRWQRGLAKDDKQRVPCLWDVLALAHEAGTQAATQDSAPALVNGIGIDKLILTARSPGARAATVRELEHAGYRMPDPLDGKEGGLIHDWRPDLSSPRVTISYHDGLFMVAGLDKGVMLLDLLKRLDLMQRYQRVVLVDDDMDNINAMQAALRTTPMGYHGIHYTRIAKLPEPGKPLDRKLQRQGGDAWKAWRALLKGTAPERLTRLDAGTCAY